VLEAAILGVARWQVDAAAVVERDGQPVVAYPGQRAGLPVEDPDAAVVTRRDDAVAEARPRSSVVSSSGPSRPAARSRSRGMAIAQVPHLTMVILMNCDGGSSARSTAWYRYPAVFWRRSW